MQEQKNFFGTHRFMVLIAATIIIAIGLTVISVAVYYTSGSSQLDLSRPGYTSVSSKVDREDTVTGYSAYGDVNRQTIDEFTKLYDTQAAKAKAVDAFNGDPLNPEVLEFGDPASSE